MEDFGVISARLRLAIKGFSEFIEHATARIEARDVFSLQPPSRRRNASDTLTTSTRQLKDLADECRSAMHEFSSILTRVERTQHDCQLALVPISALPAEILTAIFQFATVSSSPPNTSSSVILLSQVCSRWRGVADGCSALWTDFTFDQHMPPHVYQKHLERAGQRALRLTVRDTLPSMPYSLSGLPSSGLGNITHLQWTSRVHLFDTLLRRDRNVFSRLETLTLHAPNCSLCGYYRNFSTSNRSLDFPRLKHLTFGNLVISRLRVTAPLLVSLTLCEVYGQLDDLDVLLNGLQTLESFTLEESVEADDGDLEDATMTFRLPMLRHLALRHVTSEQSTLLLSSSRYPLLQRFEFLHSDEDDTDFITEPMMLSRFIRDCPLLEEVVAVCLHDVLRGVIEGIDPRRHIDPPIVHDHHPPPDWRPAPNLRTLTALITPCFHDELFHEEQEHLVLSDMERVLHVRKLEGYASLDVLTVNQCAPCRCDIIALLEELVDTLIVGRCDDVQIVGSESESDEGEEDGDDDDDDDSDNDSDDGSFGAEVFLA